MNFWKNLKPWEQGLLLGIVGAIFVLALGLRVLVTCSASYCWIAFAMPKWW